MVPRIALGEQDQQVPLLSMDVGERLFDPHTSVEVRLIVNRPQVDGSLEIVIGRFSEPFAVGEVIDFVLAGGVEVLRRFLDRRAAAMVSRGGVNDSFNNFRDAARIGQSHLDRKAHDFWEEFVAYLDEPWVNRSAVLIAGADPDLRFRVLVVHRMLIGQIPQMRLVVTCWYSH